MARRSSDRRNARCAPGRPCAASWIWWPTSAKDVAAPLVLFSYANPVVRYGVEAFAARAAEVGVDGVLLLDLPLEEAGPTRDVLVAHGLAPIFLLSPTTTAARVRKANELGRGFLYAISRLGVTGVRATGRRRCARRWWSGCAQDTTLPIALGFGLSRPEHIRDVGRYADAAVVGSALVAQIAKHGAVAGPGRRGAGVRALAARGSLDMSDPDWRMRALRERIDALDEQIVALLNERASCALEIGEIKRVVGLEIYQPGREKDVLDHVRRVNRGAARRRRGHAAVRANHRRGAASRARRAGARREGDE